MPLKTSYARTLAEDFDANSLGQITHALLLRAHYCKMEASAANPKRAKRLEADAAAYDAAALALKEITN